MVCSGRYGCGFRRRSSAAPIPSSPGRRQGSRWRLRRRWCSYYALVPGSRDCGQRLSEKSLSTNRLFSRGISLWAEEEPMRPIRIPTLSPEQLDALEELYRTTREARLRTRAQMVLLAAERRLTAAEIAEIVRASEETVRRWLKRYLAEGVEGLRDVPHPGAPRKVT